MLKSTSLATYILVEDFKHWRSMLYYPGEKDEEGHSLLAFFSSSDRPRFDIVSDQDCQESDEEEE